MNGERVQAVIIQNRSVLFGYGCIDKAKKQFGHFFIGGRVEEGEIPEDAIIREIKEETNLKAKILFRFTKDIYTNHITFLADIGDQKPVLGFDPEETDVNKELRALQKLQFVPLNNSDGFTDIDIEYFRLLANECKDRDYYPEWYSILLQLIAQCNWPRSIYLKLYIISTEVY